MTWSCLQTIAVHKHINGRTQTLGGARAIDRKKEMLLLYLLLRLAAPAEVLQLHASDVVPHADAECFNRAM